MCLPFSSQKITKTLASFSDFRKTPAFTDLFTIIANNNIGDDPAPPAGKPPGRQMAAVSPAL